MKIFRIPEPVFKTEPLFLGNCSWKEMQAYLTKTFRVKIHEQGDESDMMGTTLRFKKSPWRVVYIEKMNRGSKSLGIAIHEIAHLVVRICEDKMVPIISTLPDGAVGDEAFCYLQEFFFCEYFHRL